MTHQPTQYRLASSSEKNAASEERVLAVSWRDFGIWRQTQLPRLLGATFTVVPPGARPPASALAWVGWGQRPSGRHAATLASRTGLPCWRLEDGFLRSIGLGRTCPPLSIVVDDVGIYYDAQGPSRLEALVPRPRGEQEHRRATELVSAWQQARVSKYNVAREASAPVQGPYVLAVDQTAGDASIRFGQADERSFHRMLDAALSEHPHLPIVLKVHPDVLSGRRQGHFSALGRAEASRVTLLASNAHPSALVESAHAVYTVTSQMGFEGLLWGKPVRTFGMPFYAGWGLTQDDVPAPDRRSSQRRVSVEDLVHAALVEYPRYIDPETGVRCEAERLVEWMGLQRRMRERFPAQVHALNFSAWKRPIVRAFFGGSAVAFVEHENQVPAGGALAVWGRSSVGNAQPQARGTESSMAVKPGSARPLQILRLEDGFLRSVGLGADLVRPLSWVIDRRGIYYDATAPSDLECLLQETAFDPPLLERARSLRQRIIQAGITKYNVGTGEWVRPAAAKRVVLVPGQVESDASIALGAQGLRTNIALLQAVRQAAPGAHVVYKPHPDVVAKLRREGVGEADALRYCDEIVVDTPMHLLLDRVDEVHVMTSLAGFEALLRGKPVTCHGSPFYAGWGLTLDAHAHPRRTRRLTLDELVAAALILYPTYVSRATGAFTTPERALDELLDWRTSGGSQAVWWRKILRRVLGWRKR